MKAKHFKKLRKKIGKVQTYKIRETAGLFGDFFGSNRFAVVYGDHLVSASSPVRAIEIYMRRFRKEHKHKNDYEREYYDETTQRWGRLMVTDESGFMRFYR